MPRVQRKAQCRAEGCTRGGIRGLGLCDKHWKRLKKFGSTNMPGSRGPKRRKYQEYPPGTRLCDRPDCGRKHEARGLCKMHYELRRTGRWNPDIEFAYERECSLDGCSNAQLSRGYCKVCYAAFSRSLRRIGATWEDSEIMEVLISERKFMAQIGAKLHASGVVDYSFPNFLVDPRS